MLILIRYGELALKSKPVRKRFEDQLAKNIKLILKTRKIKFSLRKDYGRFFLETENRKGAIITFSVSVLIKMINFCLARPLDY